MPGNRAPITKAHNKLSLYSTSLFFFFFNNINFFFFFFRDNLFSDDAPIDLLFFNLSSNVVGTGARIPY